MDDDPIEQGFKAIEQDLQTAGNKFWPPRGRSSRCDEKEIRHRPSLDNPQFVGLAEDVLRKARSGGSAEGGMQTRVAQIRVNQQHSAAWLERQHLRQVRGNERSSLLGNCTRD